MLQAARGPLPTLTEAIAGERIRGSWWGHPKGKLIFSVLSEVQESAEVAVCKLVEGKTTVIQAGQPSGEHRNVIEPWPRWLPASTREEAARLKPDDAVAALGALAPFLRK